MKVCIIEYVHGQHTHMQYEPSIYVSVCIVYNIGQSTGRQAECVTQTRTVTY